MANWWSLKITTGPDAGKTFLLKRDRTVIGRVKGDVVLRQDLELSSVHAEITFDASKGLLILCDLQSRNGSRVNGEKIEKRALIAGDKLRFGVTEMVLEPPSAEETMVSSMDAEATRVASATAKAAADAPQGNGAAAPAARSAPVEAAKSAPSEGKSEPAPGAEKREAPMSDSRDPRESRAASRSSSSPEFYGFLGRFIGVFFHPTQFFDFLSSENALISGEKALHSAFKFGIATWFSGGILAGALSYFLFFVWKTGPAGADFGTSPFAIGLTTVVGAFLIPLLALIYHGICLLLGGKGPYKVALRVFCYLTAVYFVKELVEFIPKAGPFLAMALACYMLYLLALAATRLYYVTTVAAYVSCGVSVALAVTVMWTSRNSAIRMQDEIAKLNPILNKSIGATLILQSTTTPTTAATPPTPVATAPTPAPAAKPDAAAQEPSAVAAKSEDPAPPPPAAVAAKPEDAAAPVDSAAVPPAEQQRDPAASSSGGDSATDPEPPKFPASQ